MTSPKKITDDWPVYMVSSQNTSDSDVIVRRVSCATDDDALTLVRRLCGMVLPKLAFLEIHKHYKGQVTILWGDTSTPYPRSTVVKHTCTYSLPPSKAAQTATPVDIIPWEESVKYLESNSPFYKLRAA